MPPTTQCDVWWAKPVAAPGPWPEVLDDTERARYGRFPRAEDAARYLTTRALARTVLGEMLGLPADAVRLAATCRICGGPHGKLRVLHEPGVELSLSHSGDRVVVVVNASCPVGVDVEQIRPLADFAALAERVLSASEQAQLDRRARAERATALLGYWTRKEAVLKATGDGLTVPLGNLTVSPPEQPPRLLSWTGDRAPRGPVWLDELTPGDRHIGHLAVLADTAPQVVEHDGDQLLDA